MRLTAICLLAAAMYPLPSAIGFRQAAQQGGRESASDRPSNPTTPIGAVTGRIVLAGTVPAVPIRRARVTVDGGPSGMSAVTDSDVHGEYRLDGLLAGTYRVRVEKAGYVAPSVGGGDVDPPGSRITVDRGRTTRADVALDRGAAIEGRVLTAEGDPVQDIIVSALRRVLQKGVRRHITVAKSTSDDLGQFRIHSLAAGDYYLAAASSPLRMSGWTSQSIETPAVSEPTYYPGTARVDDASPVTLKTGEGREGVDLLFATMAPSPPTTRQPDSSGAQPELGRIAGRVTAGVTGRPLVGAKMSLEALSPDRKTGAAESDATGRFEISGLPPGRYRLEAAAESHLTLRFGQRTPLDRGRAIVLRAGERFESANFALPRLGAIEGRVSDEFGDPAPNVTVQVFQVEFAGGRRRLLPVPSRRAVKPTDDHGHYRLTGLPPGRYDVAALSGAFTGQYESGGFAPTYHPSTADPSRAVPIILGADQDGASIDLELVPTLTGRIEGRLIEPSGTPVERGPVVLTAADRLGLVPFVAARALSNRDGAFEFRHVPPGSYTIQAFGIAAKAGKDASPPFGWTSITVAGGETSRVIVSLHPGTTARGQIRFEGDTSELPQPDGIQVVPRAVEFDSAPVGGGRVGRTLLGDDWAFQVGNLFGRRVIRVSLNSSAWSLQRVTLSGVDVTDTPIDFGQRDVSGLEIVLTSRGASVSGTIADENGEPDASSCIVVFSTDEARWTYPSRFVALGCSDEEGRYTVRGLPPENYVAVVLPMISSGQWQDPDFLAGLRDRGAAFPLSEEQTKILNLKSDPDSRRRYQLIR